MNKILFNLFCIITLACVGIFISCEDDEEIIEEYYLYLYGEECSILDSITDTLAPLPDSICGDTVIVDTSGSTGDLWKVELAELAPFMESFLDSSVLVFLSSMELQLERQSPTGGNTVVGTWEEVVTGYPPLIPEDLLIRIAVEDVDSTFLLEIEENDSAKDLYIHSGSWEIKEDANSSYIIY
jgi:hypothetical protein